MLETKETVLLNPVAGCPFTLRLHKTPGRDESRPSMYMPWTTTVPVPPPVTPAPYHTPLVPTSLVQPPHTWTKNEVRVWLEWCAGEFSIEPVAPDKFDMNGKALGLLTRADFMERDPTSGDLLFNALQRLISKHEIPPPCSYSPFPTIPPPDAASGFGRHITCPQLKQPPPAALVHNQEHRTNGILLLTDSPANCSMQPTFSTDKPHKSYIPILPGPVTSYPSPLPPHKDLSPKVHIPGKSVLSPALTNTDTDSALSDTESPPEGDEEMEYREELENHIHQSSEGSISRDVSADLNMPHLKKGEGDCRLLWEFIHQLLLDPKYRDYVSWEKQEELIFRIINPTGLAELWGYQKNRTNMTYEKLSRALRYYYKMNIIKKVQGKRLTYQFLQHPRNIKKGQRGARPHSARVTQQEPNNPTPQPIKHEPHNEAVTPASNDIHSVDQPPIRSPVIEAYDNYDSQCDLQLIDGRLRPTIDDDEDGDRFEGLDDHTVPYVKQEGMSAPVQDEPEDLSMKTLFSKRGPDSADYVNDEHFETHIKLEVAS
ncbi:transcription factor ETV6-like isoform X1 [Haliotis rufescens]|uniref:transcription factor ETV6-like isoform X1 n=2 Tax=Haliotis rufescens TaxID=6454 RepID=UPI001EB088C7|nr:transcription factor ETV6-like isoform X1 [Haliotis rufescens]